MSIGTYFRCYDLVLAIYAVRIAVALLIVFMIQ